MEVDANRWVYRKKLGEAHADAESSNQGHNGECQRPKNTRQSAEIAAVFHEETQNGYSATCVFSHEYNQHQHANRP